MLLSLFRTNQLFLVILLLPYIAVLHLAPIWIQDNWEPAVHGVLSHLFFETFESKTLFSQLLAGFLLFIQAVLLIRIDFRHKLSSEPTLFVGVFLVLVSSVSLPFLHLSAYHFSNFFLLLTIDQILRTYRKSRVSGILLNVGLYLGLTAFFTPAYILYILLVFVALNVLRGFNLNELVIVLVGVFIVFFLAGTLYFWNGDLALFWEHQFREGFALLDLKTGNMFTFIHLGLLVSLIIIMVMVRGQIVGRKIMEAQRKIDIFYWGMLISALVLIVQANIQENSFLVASPFLGLFLGLQWSNLRPNVGELLHLLFFLSVLLLQYRPFFLP